MFQSLREEIEAACEEADRLQAEFERDEWLRAQRAKRSAPAGVDVAEWLASRPAAKPQPAPQPQQRAVMDDATTAAWERWFDNRANQLLKKFSEMLEGEIGWAFGDERKYMHGYIDGQIKKLREEVNALRADMNIQAGIAGEISQLKGSVPVKRQKDVA